MEKNLRLRILTCVVGIPVVVGGIFLFQDYNFIFFSILEIVLRSCDYLHGEGRKEKQHEQEVHDLFRPLLYPLKVLK